MRRIPMDSAVAGVKERWHAGYLFDIILTRDTWMHRIDIARATGRIAVLSSDHDARLVADVVAEWARRHGQPFTLHLEGPAGGAFGRRRSRASGNRRRRVLPRPFRPGYRHWASHHGGPILTETRTAGVAPGTRQAARPPEGFTWPDGPGAVDSERASNQELPALAAATSRRAAISMIDRL